MCEFSDQVKERHPLFPPEPAPENVPVKEPKQPKPEWTPKQPPIPPEVLPPPDAIPNPVSLPPQDVPPPMYL